jgi:hypothetical protein
MLKGMAEEIWFNPRRQIEFQFFYRNSTEVNAFDINSIYMAIKLQEGIGDEPCTEQFVDPSNNGIN